MRVIRGRGEGGESRSTFLADNVIVGLITSVLVIVFSFLGTFLSNTWTNNTQFFHDVQKQSVKDAQSVAAEAIKLLFDSQNRLHELDNAAEKEGYPWKEYNRHELSQYLTYFDGWRHDMILSYFRIQQYFGKDAADYLVRLDEELKPKQDQNLDHTGICGKRENADLLNMAEIIECQIRIYSSSINNPDFTYFTSDGHTATTNPKLAIDENYVAKTNMEIELSRLIAGNFENYDLNIITFAQVINRRLQKLGPVSFQWQTH